MLSDRGNRKTVRQETPVILDIWLGAGRPRFARRRRAIYVTIMITAATIAAIERMRDTCLPGREAVEVGDAWSTLTRLPDVGKPHERQIIHDRRRRAAILVRLPGRGR